MNLLVALAVDEVENLRKDATRLVAKQRIEDVMYFRNIMRRKPQKQKKYWSFISNKQNPPKVCIDLPIVLSSN